MILIIKEVLVISFSLPTISWSSPILCNPLMIVIIKEDMQLMILIIKKDFSFSFPYLTRHPHHILVFFFFENFNKNRKKKIGNCWRYIAPN